MTGLENEKKRIDFEELSGKESGLNLVYNFKKNVDKVRISEVEDPVEKQKITRLILEALPEWFGLPDSREDYITESSKRPFFVAYSEEQPIGFVYLDETNCFYLSLGFKEFEIFPTLWDEWNPCQVYVMGL